MEVLERDNDKSTEQGLTSTEIARRVVALAEPISAMHEQADPTEREAFYEALSPVPLTRLESLLPNVSVYEKDETRHEGGSYKLRGATRNLQLQLQADPTIAEVHAASTGNHGRGVAIACKKAGLKAIIHVPKDISPPKRDGLLESGAELDMSAPDFDQAHQAAAALVELPGVAVVEPYDDERTMAGQASAAYEVAADLLQTQARGELDLQKDDITLWVPGGGGGFGAASAITFDELRQTGLIGQNVKVKVAQMEGCDALARQCRGGTPLTPETLDKSCDATAVLSGGELTQKIIADKRFVADVVSVPKLYVARAMEKLRERHGHGVEPAAALSLAASMQYEESNKPPVAQRRIHITVTSGANVSKNTEYHFASLLSEANRQQFAEFSGNYARREVYGLEEVLARSAGGIALDLSTWSGYQFRV